jgi:hypothetical protein
MKIALKLVTLLQQSMNSGGCNHKRQRLDGEGEQTDGQSEADVRLQKGWRLTKGI